MSYYFFIHTATKYITITLFCQYYGLEPQLLNSFATTLWRNEKAGATLDIA
jgi:hypothetical protein